MLAVCLETAKLSNSSYTDLVGLVKIPSPDVFKSFSSILMHSKGWIPPRSTLENIYFIISTTRTHHKFKQRQHDTYVYKVILPVWIEKCWVESRNKTEPERSMRRLPNYRSEMIVTSTRVEKERNGWIQKIMLGGKSINFDYRLNVEMERNEGRNSNLTRVASNSAPEANLSLPWK